MDRRHGTAHFKTRVAQDKEEGWIAVELVRMAHEKMEPVARVVFWDADGQYALEMTSLELPLTIVEELISEARATIKIP